jgi:hypothetical protein
MINCYHKLIKFLKLGRSDMLTTSQKSALQIYTDGNYPNDASFSDIIRLIEDYSPLVKLWNGLEQMTSYDITTLIEATADAIRAANDTKEKGAGE